MQQASSQEQMLLAMEVQAEAAYAAESSLEGSPLNWRVLLIPLVLPLLVLAWMLMFLGELRETAQKETQP